MKLFYAVKVNIIGFGSSFQSLFPSSQKYDGETLAAAKSHADCKTIHFNSWIIFRHYNRLVCTFNSVRCQPRRDRDFPAAQLVAEIADYRRIPSANFHSHWWRGLLTLDLLSDCSLIALPFSRCLTPIKWYHLSDRKAVVHAFSP